MRSLFILTFFLISQAFAKDETKPYLVYLKPKTLLTRISDQKVIELSEGIYANVLEINPLKRDIFHVYNKAGEAIYKTSAKGVLEIEDDYNLFPKTNAEIIYPAPAHFRSNDKIAIFNSQFNLHFENLKIDSLNPDLNQDISNVKGARYEIRTLYSSNLPVNFGLGVNFQSINWSNNLGEPTTLEALSFGPYFERVLLKKESISISALFGAEFAPFYQTKSGEFTDIYKAMLFDLGLEANWSTTLGNFCIGTHFRHHDITLTSTDRANTNQLPEEINLNSLGLMLGYKYEWEL